MSHENVLPGTLGKRNWHYSKTQSSPTASGQGSPHSGGDAQEEKPSLWTVGAPHLNLFTPPPPPAKESSILPDIGLEMINQPCVDFINTSADPSAISTSMS